LDIENCGPETGPKNWPLAAGNSENYASETHLHLANSRDRRAYCRKPDMARRDSAGWLGCQSYANVSLFWPVNF
jgi:hypothetical protein